eukprot:gene4970-8564_t
MDEGTLPPVQPHKFFISGLTSGLVTTISTQPIDTVKTRQQVSKIQQQIEHQTKPVYKNLFRGVHTIYKNEGLKALYQGLPPSLLSSCISMSLFFPTYEIFRNYFRNKFNFSAEHPFTIIPSVIGSWSIASIFTSPISLIKVRLQTKKYKETGLINTAKRVIQEEGFLGLYKGYKGTYMFATQFSIYFCVYEPLKMKYNDAMLIPLISGLSTIISVLICYPNDFIVSRIMYQGKEESKKKDF